MKPATKFWLSILFIFYLALLIANIEVGIGISVVLTAIYIVLSLLTFDYDEPNFTKYHMFGKYNLVYLIVRFNKYLNKKFEKKQ